MSNVLGIIMAAGKGTRMKSSTPKVLHKVCGQSIIDYVIDSVTDVTGNKPVVIVGHEAEKVEKHIGDRAEFVLQKEMLGTGHAVMMAKDYLNTSCEYVIVLAGDTPLITSETLNNLVDYCKENDYSATLLSAIIQDPAQYGRIIRDSNNDFERIVEFKDANEEQLKVKEINASMYCFKTQDLAVALDKIENKNAQGEYYLTDTLGILKSEGKKVGVIAVDQQIEITGINKRQHLAFAEKIMRERINNKHMDNGVTFINPDDTYIENSVIIENDVTIYPGNILQGKTKIEKHTTLYPNNRLEDSIIHEGVTLQSSVILNSEVGSGTTVGPYAYIRPGTKIENNARVGDFVELKNANIGQGTKVSHLTYIGDADVGSGVNVGCGVVFVNYDGKNKYRTVVGDNSFIGCNVNLVSPVEVEKGAYIAAGSTITKKVDEGDLAVARARQTNIKGWVEKSGKWGKKK